MVKMMERAAPSRRIAAMAACCLLVSACGPQDAEPGSMNGRSPDSMTLIANARIYTFDPGDTVIDAGAMAFSADGEIVALGDNDAMAATFPEARRIDLGGRTVLPGLIDSHGHLYELARALTRADLVGTRNKQEVIDRLQAFAVGLAPGAWLLGRGWDQNDWPAPEFPDRGDLDSAFPDRPVWLERIDGHAAWGNSRALAKADRDLSGDWQPEGGMIHRGDDGAATGIFIDNAMALVERAVPPPPPELMDAALDRALQRLVGVGLTGIHDPGVGRPVVETYRARVAAGDLPLRVYAMADGVGATLDWLCENGALEHPSGRLTVRAVKLYADGALGSRGAALMADYSDDTGNRGLRFQPDERLDAQLGRVMSCGLQAAVHAIGDRANRQVLDAYERLLPKYPDNPGRHRIEHAQVVDPADIPRFAELGVIAAMQPIHATSDMYWADERLGEGRLAGAYAWKSLLESGATLAFGSDFPVEEANPMLGIYAAVTRQDLDGWPEGDEEGNAGWQPQERLTRTQAVRAYTLDAARAAFMDSEVGSLERGKRADFIVLDRDPLQVPVGDIPGVAVHQTWVDGARVFEREGT